MNFYAEVISVGTELLLGSIANTDAQFISEALSAVGVDVLYHTAVGDNPQRLRSVTEIARQRANLILYVGGLGPTYDDMTKEVVARAFGRELVFHPEIFEEIRRCFADIFHRPMPACNRQQAFLPAGCEIFHNPVGTAPGCCFEEGGVTVMMLPGVPHECRHMLHHQALPWLRRHTEQVILSHDLRIFGLSEPQVQELLAPVMNEAVNPSLAPYAKTGEVLLRLTAKAESEAACTARMAPLLSEVRRRLGDYCYGEDIDGLEYAAVRLLKEKHCTCAAAESCTGGLIAKRITDVPGASAVFRGGIVSYTNEVKAAVLGVPQALLDTYGAVSQPVAAAMADGARRVTGADLAVSSTGVAGPDRDDRGNEVGTVFVGLSTPEGTFVRSLSLGTGRQRVRTTAAHHAFDLIRRYLAGLDVETNPR